MALNGKQGCPICKSDINTAKLLGFEKVQHGVVGKMGVDYKK